MNILMEKLDNKMGTLLKKLMTILVAGLLLFSLYYYHFRVLKANFYLNLAEWAFRQNDFGLAFWRFQKALKVNTKILNPYIRYRYGKVALAYAKYGRYLDYEINPKVLKEAVVLQERNAEKEWPYFTRNFTVAGRLSNILFRLGEDQYHKKATQFFERALQLSPDRPSIYLGLARTRIIAGEFDEAESKIKKGLSFNRTNPKALFQLAILKIRQGESRRAWGILEKRADLGTDFFDFDSLNRLALAFERAGNKEQAERFRRALRSNYLKPRSP